MNEHDARQQRIWLLLRHGRPDRAEEELRLYLADHPDSDFAHAQLALCLVQLGRFQDAHQEATAAVGLAPDQPFCHYVQSIVLLHANCLPEAEAAIQEAIGLDQTNSRHFGQLAKIYLACQKWPEALQAAEQGLEIDPGDDDCANLRSIALIRLGRRVEATDSLRGALQRDPDDVWTHANLGWSLIEQGQYENAMTHFREALRLEPDLEHARLGIITALRAQHILYRPILRYFLWSQKLNERFAFLLMIGAFLLIQLISDIARKNPDWAPVVVPIIFAYIIFAVSTWLANPLFNLVLMTNKFGRLALNEEEKSTAIIVASSLSAATLLLILSFVSPLPPPVCRFASIGVLLATLPLSKIYEAEPGKSRRIVVALGLAVSFMAIFPVFFILTAMIGADSLPKSLLNLCGNLAGFCIHNFNIAAIGSQLISQGMAVRRPRRISL